MCPLSRGSFTVGSIPPHLVPKFPESPGIRFIYLQSILVVAFGDDIMVIGIELIDIYPCRDGKCVIFSEIRRHPHQPCPSPVHKMKEASQNRPSSVCPINCGLIGLKDLFIARKTAYHTIFNCMPPFTIDRAATVPFLDSPQTIFI